MKAPKLSLRVLNKHIVKHILQLLLKHVNVVQWNMSVLAGDVRRHNTQFFLRITICFCVLVRTSTVEVRRVQGTKNETLMIDPATWDAIVAARPSLMTHKRVPKPKYGTYYITLSLSLKTFLTLGKQTPPRGNSTRRSVSGLMSSRREAAPSCP
jgi:hypothetical protein